MSHVILVGSRLGMFATAINDTWAYEEFSITLKVNLFGSILVLFLVEMEIIC